MKIFGLICLLTILISMIWGSYISGDYKTANRESAGIAPKASEEPEALVQLYSARAFGWRRPFGLHTWIATKEKSADHYLVYQVVGWRAFRGENVVVIDKSLPDRAWFGSPPNLLATLKGEAAESAIKKITAAAASYPYPGSYRIWPGPNSNTFISYILRQTPEFGMELPPNAIGKDWINKGDFWGRSESGTGYQISVLGLLGLIVGIQEGIEINVLGLSLGVDFLRPALKLPFIGRVGMSDRPA